MKLHFDDATEALRGELREWLAANRPTVEEMAAEPAHSSAHLPPWARDWQRRLFDAGWLVPGWPPELGGRNATPVAADDLLRGDRAPRDPAQLQPAGSRRSSPRRSSDYGTPEQQRALPPPDAAGRDRLVPRHERARRRQRPREPEDARRARRRPLRRQRSEGVDVGRAPRRLVPLLRAHRSRRAEAQGHQRAHHRHDAARASTRRRSPSSPNRDYRDFNEVFFTDVVVPAENLLGELNGGWPITQGSLAHERAMLWIDVRVRARQRALRALVALGDRAGRRRGRARRRRAASATRSPGSTSTRRRCMLMGYRGFSKFLRGKVRARALAAQAARQRDRCSGAAWSAPRRGRRRRSTSDDSARQDVARDVPWAIQYLRSFAARSPAAPARSSATSSPSACSACRVASGRGRGAAQGGYERCRAFSRESASSRSRSGGSCRPPARCWPTGAPTC